MSGQILHKGLRIGPCTLSPLVGAVRRGEKLLEELSRIRKSVDRAILILSPESTTVVRRKKHAIPNLNVLFEFGFFYSALGKERIANGFASVLTQFLGDKPAR